MTTFAKWERPTNDAGDDAECYCGSCDRYLPEEWTYCPDCGEEIIYHEYDHYKKYARMEKKISAMKRRSKAIRDKNDGLRARKKFRKNISRVIDPIN